MKSNKFKTGGFVPMKSGKKVLVLELLFFYFFCFFLFFFRFSFSNF